jgi:hypothetical protein
MLINHFFVVSIGENSTTHGEQHRTNFYDSEKNGIWYFGQFILETKSCVVV